MSKNRKPGHRSKRSRQTEKSQAPNRAEVLSVVARNLVNMVAVFAVSGTVLVGLLIIKRF